MKIIKEGVDPDLLPLNGTCRKCKTEIEFMREEAEYVHAPTSEDVDCYKIECPVCKASVVHEIDPDDTQAK